jgi:hypothetical protein
MRRPPKNFSCWRIGLKCKWSPKAYKSHFDYAELATLFPPSRGPWVACMRCGFVRRMTQAEIERNGARGGEASPKLQGAGGKFVKAPQR